MRPGAKIQHPELGEGTVEFIVSRGGRAGAQVNFGYMSEWISWEELTSGSRNLVQTDGESLEGTPLVAARSGPERKGTRPGEESAAGKPSPGPAPGWSNAVSEGFRVPRLSSDVVEARRAILALKLGQILEENVLDLSTGTDDIQTSLERAVSAVARRQPASILFKGSWGSGKTHLLTMLTKLAADGGLATASVILDGEGVRLSEPMGLMETLLGSLRYPGDAMARGISERVVSLRHEFAYEYRYSIRQRLTWRLADAIFNLPLRCLNDPDAMDLLEDYFRMTLPATHANQKLRRLGNRGIYLFPLKAWRVAERPNRFCNLLKGWAEFSVLTGAKGLAVVFDEVDVEYASTIWNARQRYLRGELLKKFRAVLREDVPLLLAFGSAPASDDDDANDPVSDLVRGIGGFDLEIEAPQPNLEQTRELGQRLTRLYAGAYPERMANVDQQRLKALIDQFASHHQRELNPVPRNFVRGTLERLDVAPGLVT